MGRGAYPAHRHPCNPRLERLNWSSARSTTSSVQPLRLLTGGWPGEGSDNVRLEPFTNLADYTPAADDPGVLTRPDIGVRPR